MPGIRFLVSAAAMAVFAVGQCSPCAAAPGMKAVAISTALGGSLGDGMNDAGGPGHGKLDMTVELRPARTEVYRRQVAAALLAAGRLQKTGGMR